MTSHTETWIFASYMWQGNPKALFLYMRKYHPEALCVWLAQTEEQAGFLRSKGINAIAPGSTGAEELLSACDVFVVENFREAYPKKLNSNAVILNLWHGVGLKPVEIGVGPNSEFSNRIARKYIRYFRSYRENHLFLATSKKMEERFSPEMKLLDHQIVRGPYPRNQVYRDADLCTFNLKQELGYDFDSFDTVALYAPTWRRHNVSDSFAELMPDFGALVDVVTAQNMLLIVKVHPFMENDLNFKMARDQYAEHPHVVFWPEGVDLYEVFSQIDLAIVDYSSIYYDLLAAGVDRFVRYVPDYERHVENEGFTDDYWSLTAGPIADSFDALKDVLSAPIVPVGDDDNIMQYFFGHLEPSQLSQAPLSGRQADIDAIIEAARTYEPKTADLKTLYSFDIFDTILRRKCLSPVAVFHRVQERLTHMEGAFPSYLIENYVDVRRSCERDVRVQKAQAVKEAGSGQLEVTFAEIFARMQAIFHLSEEQLAMLQSMELDIDRDMLEVRPDQMARLKALIAAGEDVILISDMYLSKEDIATFLRGIDPELCDIPLFVSSEYGHKKDSGELFKHLFFELDYQYADWVHFGDNSKADGAKPRDLGIQGIAHDIDTFSPYEAKLIQENRFLDTYLLATNMQRYRWKMLDKEAYHFNDRRYFGYAYAGPSLVFYVNWAIKDALKRGYQTLYFVTRDGILLKEIADKIIAMRGLKLRTKLLYGSRRVWRSMTTDEEITRDFTKFYGRLGGISSFSELALSAGLQEERLVQVVPLLAEMTAADFTDPAVRSAAGAILVGSSSYMEFLRAEEASKKDRCLTYLSQEMDLTEPFGIVEFWGRGVTQGQLAKLLEEVAGKEVNTPFYYVRSIWGDEPNCPRHRFSEMAVDFNFLEPVLACVPQTTVTAYEKVGDRIEPVYEVLEQEGYEDLRVGLLDFTEDYCNTAMEDHERLERGVANSAYRYLRSTPSDQYICDVYAEFTDNHGVYAEIRAQAPVLSAKEIAQTAGSDLKQLTKSLPISLARSDQATRKAFTSKFPKKKLSAARQPVFPKLPLERYVRVQQGQKIIARKDLAVYWCLSFSKGSKTGKTIPAGTVVRVEEVVWNQGGTPRAKTSLGYVTLNRGYVASCDLILRVSSTIASSGKASSARPISGDLISILDAESLGEDVTRFHTLEGDYELKKDQFILPRGDLDNYIAKAPRYVLALSKIAVYSSPVFEDRYRTSEVIAKGASLPISGVVFTTNGTPRLKTARGFITASKDLIRPLRSDLHEFFSKPLKRLNLKKPLTVYSSPEFTDGTRSEQTLNKGAQIQAGNLVWTEEGTPRIVVKNGYVSAHKSNFRSLFGFPI